MDDSERFDRVIKKTFDRDCQKFFQRIDKLKRMNSCGHSSQRSKSSVSVSARGATVSNARRPQTFRHTKNDVLSSLSGGVTPAATTHEKLNLTNLNRHGHSFSQIMPSSLNVRNCNSKLFKPLLQQAPTKERGKHPPESGHNLNGQISFPSNLLGPSMGPSVGPSVGPSGFTSGLSDSGCVQFNQLPSPSVADKQVD